ncbi:hypothetical protein Aperf_G00000032123 [Anoplocephala perfoliata]
MTSLKPLPNSKAKKPLYYDEKITIYPISKVKQGANHNAEDALEELKKQLQNKKPTKNSVTAEEEALQFKKKIALSPSLKSKTLPYSDIKAFYQFSNSPAFTVLGVQGKGIPKEYIVFANPNVDKANKLTEILQVAQWTQGNNLKNKPSAVSSAELAVVGDVSEKSNTSLRTPPTVSRSPARKSSFQSPSPQRNSTHMSRTPAGTSAIPDRYPISAGRPVGQPSQSILSRTRSMSTITERTSTSPVRQPNSAGKSLDQPRSSTLSQIPVRYNNEATTYFAYNPKKNRGQKSWGSTNSVIYYAPKKQGRLSKAEPVGDTYILTERKPRKPNKTKTRRATSESQLAPKIYYLRPDMDETGSSSDNESEIYFGGPSKPKLSRSRRHSSSSTSSTSSSSYSLSPTERNKDKRTDNVIIVHLPSSDEL